MGVLTDHNFEAMHFLSLNQLALQSAKADWLNPVEVNASDYDLPKASVLYAEHLKLNTRLQKLRYTLMPLSWGWKDPRNTFTLNLWLKHFPKAKVIYVERGVDAIAKSLQKRNVRPGEVYDKRLDDLNFNRALAEKYQQQASKYDKLGKRFCSVSYEDLTALNQAEIKKLEKFTGRKLYAHFKTLVK